MWLVPFLSQGDPSCLSSSETRACIFGLHLLAVLPLPLEALHQFSCELRLSLRVGVCTDPSEVGMGDLQWWVLHQPLPGSATMHGPTRLGTICVSPRV